MSQRPDSPSASEKSPAVLEYWCLLCEPASVGLEEFCETCCFTEQQPYQAVILASGYPDTTAHVCWKE